jgi:hypothetical protein
MAAITASICAIVLTAGANQPVLHLIACALIATLMTLNAVRENRSLIADGASKNLIAASTARNLGMAWAWGAIGIMITYAVVLEQRWPEWWQFFVGFALAAVGSLMYAGVMNRDEAKGKADDAMHRVGRTLIIVQAVGVAIGLISMFVDGKFPRATSYADWAGCNIFFFGGLTILAISLNALRSAR